MQLHLTVNSHQPDGPNFLPSDLPSNWGGCLLPNKAPAEWNHSTDHQLGAHFLSYWWCIADSWQESVTRWFIMVFKYQSGTNHSHSMINEPSKLLIHKGFDAASALLPSIWFEPQNSLSGSVGIYRRLSANLWAPPFAVYRDVSTRAVAIRRRFKRCQSSEIGCEMWRHKMT